ncbi:MAG: hypothetical protein O2909_03655 [Chloroflexi bacterium]|nr:hypothetical protein [Chloroflexota bacterium]MDA1218517.1 hypothetical protein [Chloroflexota bacterium]
MFIGHYAVALALKKTEPRASLGVLFLAAQLADIIFFPLAIVGIEKVSIIPGFTEASPLRLDFVPFSHGLLGAAAASVLAYFVIRMIPAGESVNRNRIGLVVALAVFSHWVLDVVSHTPDMPLIDGGLPKLGFGLWYSAIGTYAVEAVMVLAGLLLYLRASGGTTRFTKYGMIGFVAFMLLLNAFNVFQPTPPETGVLQLGITALIAYFIFAALAFWLDRKRMPGISQ